MTRIHFDLSTSRVDFPPRLCDSYSLSLFMTEVRPRSPIVEVLTDLGTPLRSRFAAERHAALLNLLATYDHVDPNTDTGDGVLGNLVTTCWFCQPDKVTAIMGIAGTE